MTELHLVPVPEAHGPLTLRVTADPEPGVTPLLSVSEEGEVKASRLCQTDSSFRLLRELRRPSNLLRLTSDQSSDPIRWQATRLLLAAWKEMRDHLDRKADHWTRTLLLILQAHASLRSFAAAAAADPEPWDQRAAQDLLDAAAALDFFDSRRLAPFLQWMVAVLHRERARGLVDRLLPVEDGAFVARLGESGHRELQRVVQAVAHAQRRQYFLGRYDLGGAARLRGLLAHLRHPRSRARALFSRGWLFVADLCVPRLLAGCVVGILPFLVTDEAWRLATDLSVPLVGGLAAFIAVAVLGYLAYDRQQADPAGLSPSGGIVRVWAIGIVESFALAGVIQWLVEPSGHTAVLEQPGGFNPGVFLASAACALGVGVFTQLIWQDKAVTAPP